MVGNWDGETGTGKLGQTQLNYQKLCLSQLFSSYSGPGPSISRLSASRPYPLLQLKGKTAKRRLRALDLKKRIRRRLGKRFMVEFARCAGMRGTREKQYVSPVFQKRYYLR